MIFRPHSIFTAACTIATVAALTLSSCSKIGSGMVVDGGQASWAEDESARVPVEFARISVATKGSPVNALEDLQGRTFGVMGISASGLTDELMSRAATLDESGQVVMQDDQGNIQTLYYPISSADNYNLYSYYCGDGVSYGSGLTSYEGALVKVEDYGKTDVMWSCSQAPELYTVPEGKLVKGYNARYMRTLVEQGLYDDDHLPHLDMKHMCSMIDFVFRYDRGSSIFFNHVYVTEVTAHKVPAEAFLQVEAGRLQRSVHRGQVSYEKILRVENDPVRDSTACFFFAPEDLDSLSFSITLALSSALPQTQVQITESQIKQVFAEKKTPGFKVGSRYTFEVLLSRSGYGYKTSVKAFDGE